MAHMNTPASRATLRLWPGLALGAVLLTLWLGLPLVWAGGAAVSMLGGVGVGVLVILWWLFFSRARWSERLAAVALMAVGVAAVSRFVHPSISNAMMGMMLPFYSIPVLSLTLVAWALLARSLSGAARYATMGLAILAACAAFTLVRTDGITGDAESQLRWRWTPTAEERLLAQQVTPVPEPPAAVAPSPTAPTPAPADFTASAQSEPSTEAAPPPANEVPEPVTRVAEWPGFRGARRDGAVAAAPIATDWGATPPVELWRRPVGPGWSSFAVAGDLIYTQEQRGDDEIVASYRLSTGEPVWMHKDRARFWESNGGAGPRATPTVHGDCVYAMGATGLVNALDARTGRRLWSRDAAADTGAKQPGWGFAASPLVVADLVVVAASGRLVAYDVNTGTPRWKGPTTGGGGYSSPHLITAGGVDQIVFLRGGGAIGVAPADGAVLWEHTWEEGASIVQPAVTAEGDLLIGGVDSMGGLGLRRLAIAKGSSNWTVTERWTSRGLKPYFNDFVVHKGHAFGFDGSILSAVNLETGERAWKGGRYGHGQMVLLRSQDLLLVLSEEGDIALVSATPEKFVEVARAKAIEGKTWNHPVLVGQVVLVRNGEEMAAFRLPSPGRGTE
jgi:outer membrane protein assembly factor BamB